MNSVNFIVCHYFFCVCVFFGLCHHLCISVASELAAFLAAYPLHTG